LGTLGSMSAQPDATSWIDRRFRGAVRADSLAQKYVSRPKRIEPCVFRREICHSRRRKNAQPRTLAANRIACCARQLDQAESPVLVITDRRLCDSRNVAFFPINAFVAGPTEQLTSRLGHLGSGSPGASDHSIDDSILGCISAAYVELFARNVSPSTSFAGARSRFRAGGVSYGHWSLLSAAASRLVRSLSKICVRSPPSAYSDSHLLLADR
jgi:hypothetical protein